MTNPTDEIEDALDREHVLCDCDEKAGENGGHWASCALRVRGPRIAAFIAEREAGLRKALAEQMDNTIAHQKRADVALDWNRLSVKQRDELQAKLDEAENIARQNGYERDASRAQLADRDCELELLREIQQAAHDYILSHDSMVVRFQDATLAQAYEDRARKLEELIDAYRAKEEES